MQVITTWEWGNLGLLCPNLDHHSALWSLCRKDARATTSFQRKTTSRTVQNATVTHRRSFFSISWPTTSLIFPNQMIRKRWIKGKFSKEPLQRWKSIILTLRTWSHSSVFRCLMMRSSRKDGDGRSQRGLKWQRTTWATMMACMMVSVSCILSFLFFRSSSIEWQWNQKVQSSSNA